MARPAEPLRPLRGPRASHTGGLISTRNQRTGFTYRAARLAGPCFIPPVLLDPNQVPSTRRCKATWEERLCGWGWAQARRGQEAATALHLFPAGKGHWNLGFYFCGIKH